MNYKDTNDYEVLYLIGENEDVATNVIYDKYKPIIYSLANKYYKLMKGKGLELDDFIQEGYIGLDRALKNYTVFKDCLFYTFASLCIERQMQTLARNSNARKHEILNNALSLDYNISVDSDLLISDIIGNDKGIDPIDNVLEDEYQVKLINFRNDLSNVHGQIFELRYNGFNYNEISNLLGVSYKTVDSCLVRVRQNLKDLGLYKGTI